MSARRAVQLVAFLWVAAAAAAAGQLLLQLLIARTMGPADYGVVVSSLALVSIVAPLAGFGLPTFWLRAFGQEGWQGVRWLPTSFGLLFVSSAFVVGCLLLWAHFGAMPALQRSVIAVLSSYVIGQTTFELVSSKLQLEERYGALALWQILPPAMRLALVSLLALAASQSPLTVALCFLMTTAVVISVGCYELSRMARGSFDLKGHGARQIPQAGPRPALRNVVAESWVFGLDNIFFLLYLQSGVVLLAKICGSRDAGMYNAAFVIMMAVYLFPGVVYQKFLAPTMHRWAQQDRVRLVASFKLGNRVMLAAGLISLAFLWVVGNELITFVYGDRYGGSAAALSILAMCAPLRFLSANAGCVMSAGGSQSSKIVVMGIAALLNLIVGALLIPSMGMTGAAWAAVISEGAVLVGLWAMLWRKKILHV